jgi:PilZ domain
MFGSLPKFTGVERRKEARCPIDETVEIYEVTPQSETLIGPAVMRDISSAGACVRMQSRLSVGTAVRLVSCNRNMHAIVRHAGAVFGGFLIGMEFAPAPTNQSRAECLPVPATW